MKKFFPSNPALRTGCVGSLGVLLCTAVPLDVVAPATARAQTIPAASRATSMASVDLSSLFFSLPPGPEAPAPTDQIQRAMEMAALDPFTGPPPPVECIPGLIDNPFSAFPPQSICQ